MFTQICSGLRRGQRWQTDAGGVAESIGESGRGAVTVIQFDVSVGRTDDLNHLIASAPWIRQTERCGIQTYDSGGLAAVDGQRGLASSSSRTRFYRAINRVAILGKALGLEKSIRAQRICNRGRSS